MSETKYLITHYQRKTPNPYGWFETSFITTRLDKSDEYYWGYDENKKIELEEVHYYEQKGTFKKIESIISVDDDKSVWIAENGDVWLANSNDPFNVHTRRLIETKLQPSSIAAKSVLAHLKNKPISLDFNSIDEEKLPVFIKNDLKKLIYKIEQDRTILNELDSSRLTIFDPSYISDLDSSIETIRDKIESLEVNPQQDPDDENELLFDTVGNEYFYTIPTLFLYPFFLDKRRANVFNCGVIPYGKQTMLAVVINKKSHLYEKWSSKRISVEAELKDSFDGNDKNGQTIGSVGLDRYIGSLGDNFSVQWFKDLIEYIVETKGTMQFVYGYIFLEIVKQFVLEHFDDDSYIRKLKSVEIPVDSINNNPQSQFYFKYKRNISRNISQNKVLILDPSDALNYSKNGKEYFKKLNKGYDIVYVKHNIDIEVGVGYSMFAIPSIVKENRWKSIQSIALKELRKHKNLLLNAGIEIYEMNEVKANSTNSKKVEV